MHTPLSAQGGSSGLTVTVAADGRAAATPPRRCMALAPGSGPHLSDELHCLLRRRLRIAVLIAWTGSSLFLVRNFLLIGTAQALTPSALAIACIASAVLTVLGALLWSTYPIGTANLRRLELGLFGTMALYFVQLQFATFDDLRLMTWTEPSHQEKMLTLGAHANALRWLILIVLYGTFIPNTWKRCTVVVGILVALPLLLNITTCWNCPIMGPHTWTATFDPLVILSVGAAIAIFGSYKISTLQAEAFAARQLGQYQLRRKLGEGGMGEVYLGEHTLLRRACAIKLIRPDQAGDPTNLARFEREVRAMATLTHWNTVEIYDYGRADDGTFYYVMEYLPGMSLQELIEQYGPLPPGRAIHFLRQVCAGLKEAHAIGLIHRDIKPSNVFVCQRGGVDDVVKLLDFGLVKNIGPHQLPIRETIQGVILGSPLYMSPEQAMGKGNIDGRTDIYSLGGLAYFLLSGQSPFSRDSAMEHLIAHLHEPVLPPRQLSAAIPEDLEEIILRCLQKKPEDRFADIAGVDRALAECEAAGTWDAEQAEQWWESRERIIGRQPEFVATVEA